MSILVPHNSYIYSKLLVNIQERLLAVIIPNTKYEHVVIIMINYRSDFLHSSDTGKKVRVQSDSTSAIHRFQESL
jgi:hypothetical protein